MKTSYSFVSLLLLLAVTYSSAQSGKSSLNYVTTSKLEQQNAIIQLQTGNSQGTKQPGQSDLAAYYPFNGNINDESGNGNNATYIGAGVTLTSDRFGIRDKAYYFDGTINSSYIRIPSDNFPTTDRTISFWFNADIVSNRPTPLCYGGNGCNSSSFLLNINNSNNPNEYLVQGHCNDAKISAPYATDPVNKWYHFTVTINGSVQKIYINGVLQQTTANYITPTYVNGRSVIIGDVINTDGNTIYTSSYAGAFKGKLDDFRFYTIAMTDEEVMNLYTRESNIGLVAFYPFNNNANDESGNNNNGNVSGALATPDRFGVSGQAYNFNGAGNFITVADNPILFADNMTLSWWYKVAEYRAGANVVIGWVDGGYRYQQFFNGNSLCYLNGYNLSGSGIYFNPTYNVAETDKWQHVVVTYKKLTETSSTSSLYINGELKQSDNHGLAIAYMPGPNLFIGKNHDGAYFKGDIDDIRIYNRVITNDEIKGLYNDSSTYFPPNIADNLVAFFPFNGNADDASGNLNHGIVTNAVLTADRYGEVEKAYLFDGVNSYIEGTNPGHNLPIGNSPRSFTAWAKDYAANNWGSNIFHYGTMEPAPTNFHFLITDVLGLGNGYGYGVTYGKTDLIDSTWHFVCGTYTDTDQTVRLYVDGKIDNSEILSSAPNTVLSTNWRIGLFLAGGTPFNGKLDEIKVFSLALTDPQINEMYLAETTAPTLKQPNDQSLIPSLTQEFIWESTIPSAAFRFQLALDSLFETILYEEKTSALYTHWPGIPEQTHEYYWRVQTILNGEKGPWSEVWRFTYNNVGLVEFQQNHAALDIKPNPADASIKISYSVPASSGARVPVNLEILNSLGVSSVTITENNILPGNYEIKVETSTLKPGIYFCRLKAGNNLVVRKLVVIH